MQEFCFSKYKISCSSDEIEGNLKLNKTSNLKTQFAFMRCSGLKNQVFYLVFLGKRIYMVANCNLTNPRNQ